MKTVKIYHVNCPTWALPLIVNGDSSGLTPDESNQVIQWVNDFQTGEPSEHTVFSPDLEDDQFFTWSPAFGLACDCIKMTVIILEA